jgi:hypothetical protein
MEYIDESQEEEITLTEYNSKSDEHPIPADVYNRQEFEESQESGVESEQVTGEDAITHPFDPTLIRIETLPVTVNLLLSRIEEGEIDLNPEFQRKAGIWKNDVQSRLIESLLMRIPLPAFYIDGTDENRWIVVDGLQRITTLKRFVIDQELKLEGLEFLTNFTGYTYDNLPRNFQRRIQETQLTVYLVSRGTPEEVKFTIFRRINTGGKPLSSQEIRHALNQGKATRLLEELALSPEFLAATANGVSDTRMDDRELVLRFLAFTITPYSNYKVQDFDAFLYNSMKIINELSDAEIDSLKKQFKRAMRAAKDIFGEDAFRKRYHQNDRRKPINKSLFESWSVNLNSLSDEQLDIVLGRKYQVQQKFMELMHNRDFEQAISQGTGDVAKVERRFGLVKHLIQEVLA